MEFKLEYYELLQLVTEDLVPQDLESKGIFDSEKSKWEEHEHSNNQVNASVFFF